MRTHNTDQHHTPAALEPLEARRLASASPLVINGTDGADTIRIRQSGSTLTVTRNGANTTRKTADVSSVVVNGRGGADSITADDSVKVRLTLSGGPGNDMLRGGSAADVLRGDSGNDTIQGGGGNDQVHGNDGNDSLSGNAGDDRLWAGAGDDTLDGGDGADVLVSIGGAGDDDRLAGGAGADQFWADPAPTDRVTDRSAGDLYKPVGAFMTYRIARADGSFSKVPVSTKLQGQDLPDPVASKKISGREDYSINPLFAADGPTEQDVDQNGAADCYFLSSLAGLARTAPEHVKGRVVDLGDGTYAVHFQDYDRNVYVRVDADLPVDNTGKPFYAGLGQDKSIWVPVLEKAWAFYRRSQGTYASIDFGRSKEVFKALGMQDVAFQDSFRSAASMLDTIDAALDAGLPLTFWTKMTEPKGSPLRPSHVLTGVRVIRDARGNPTHLVLRDPLKNDGARAMAAATGEALDGSNDGYLTITAAQAAAAMKGVTWARV